MGQRQYTGKMSSSRRSGHLTGVIRNFRTEPSVDAYSTDVRKMSLGSLWLNIVIQVAFTQSRTKRPNFLILFLVYLSTEKSLFLNSIFKVGCFARKVLRIYLCTLKTVGFKSVGHLTYLLTDVSSIFQYIHDGRGNKTDKMTKWLVSPWESEK